MLFDDTLDICDCGGVIGSVAFASIINVFGLVTFFLENHMESEKKKKLKEEGRREE